MIDSARLNPAGDVVMDDREMAQRRRLRRQRIDRVQGRGGAKVFFGSPYAAVICMLVALGSIIGYWRGVPSWALLALGMGAVLIIAGAGFFWRSNRRSR
jgi:hypothetical protein